MNDHRPRVLQIGRLLPALEARLAADYDVTLLAQQDDPERFLAVSRWRSWSSAGC
jgi:hydroxypyruvate reductase